MFRGHLYFYLPSLGIVVLLREPNRQLTLSDWNIGLISLTIWCLGRPTPSFCSKDRWRKGSQRQQLLLRSGSLKMRRSSHLAKLSLQEPSLKSDVWRASQAILHPKNLDGDRIFSMSQAEDGLLFLFQMDWSIFTSQVLSFCRSWCLCHSRTWALDLDLGAFSEVHCYNSRFFTHAVLIHARWGVDEKRWFLGSVGRWELPFSQRGSSKDQLHHKTSAAFFLVMTRQFLQQGMSEGD